MWDGRSPTMTKSIFLCVWQGDPVGEEKLLQLGERIWPTWYYDKSPSKWEYACNILRCWIGALWPRIIPAAVSTFSIICLRKWQFLLNWLRHYFEQVIGYFFCGIKVQLESIWKQSRMQKWKYSLQNKHSTDLHDFLIKGLICTIKRSCLFSFNSLHTFCYWSETWTRVFSAELDDLVFNTLLWQTLQLNVVWEHQTKYRWNSL